jgi:class 3 adenylate cyclase
MACPSCGRENPDGARFCIECGTSLVPACPACGAELPDGARFCPSCGAAVSEEVPPPAGQERRLVTILFADVTGSTSLGERLDPERLQELLAVYFDAMREEIEGEGGTIEKFIGDAIMAAFGVPAAHEDDPARALRAALRMRRRLEEVNRSLERRFGHALQIRTGVNTGEVLAAVDARPDEPMVTGDAVNVAARLEQMAEPGWIVVAERTARAARGFRYTELGPQDLRGKERPVAAVRLEGEAPERAERGVPGLQAPMVGRDQELALLQTLFSRVVTERRPHLVTIYGDPGVGKSRLVREFLAWTEAREPSPTIAFGRCLPYGDGVAYWPLAEILKSHAGVLDNDPTEVVLGKIATSCDDVLSADAAIDATTACGAIAYTVGLEFPSTPMRDLEPRQVRERMHSAWRSFFSTLSLRTPVVVVIEDIHWADTALLDLLEHLADRVVGPVLFVCPARPELTDRRPGWGGGHRNGSSLSIEPLSADHAERLVRLLLSVEDLPDPVRRQILARAEGNPFFLEEIVRHLIDDGRIVRSGDRWRASEHIGEVEIPDTVQAVLAARIDLLDPPHKRTLQRAAVVGRVFWPGPVGRLLNGDREHLREALERLEERELVRSRPTSAIAGEPEFIFKHILTRDVAYETLPRRERSRAHASVAEWIESTAGDRRGEFAELLAHHYEQAYLGAPDSEQDVGPIEGLRSRAVEALLEAAEVTRRRFATETSFRLIDRALPIADTSLERARTLEQRGRVARDDYRGDLSWTSYRDAVDIRLRDLPDEAASIARACAGAVENPMRWPGSMEVAPPEDEVRRYVDIGLERAAEGSPTRIRLLTAAAFAPFAFNTLRGTTPEEVESCRRLGIEAAEAALALGRPDLASAALDGAGSAVITLGDYGAVLPLIERRLRLAEEFDDPWERGDVNDMAAWTAVMVGDYERARTFGDRALEFLQIGTEGLAIHGMSWLAVAELELGHWDRVTDELGPTVERLLGTRIEDPPYFTTNLMGSLAVIEAERGDPRADRHLDLLEGMNRRAKESLGRGGVKTWIAWARLARGQVEEAGLAVEDASTNPTGGHLPLLRQVQAEHLAAARSWDRVAAFVDEMRAYGSNAGIMVLPSHLDRLEGRAALEAGDADRAIELLERASAGFVSLSARWEGARTGAFLAEALARRGRDDEARERWTRASVVLAELGATRELERWRPLEERLGSASA